MYYRKQLIPENALGCPIPYPFTVAVVVTVFVTVAIEVTVSVTVATLGSTRDEIAPAVVDRFVRLDFSRIVLGVGGLPVTVMNFVTVVVASSVGDWETG
jgi:hypothetical protein